MVKETNLLMVNKKTTNIGRVAGGAFAPRLGADHRGGRGGWSEGAGKLDG